MKLHSVKFSGEILERGFWLYIWRIKSGKKEYYYVGRTGDNSSANAASPFGRLSQHLDVRESATANMLLRRLREVSLDPLKCEYELFALGRIFPEKKSWNRHRKFRDIIAPLERELAAHLLSEGLEVLGVHRSKGEPDKKLLAKIKRKFNSVILRESKRNN